MKKFMIKRSLIMAGVIISLIFNSVSAFAVENAKIAPMKLMKVQGTVAMIDSNNNIRRATDGMRLTSGASVMTNLLSYACIRIDDSKMIKMDALSKTKVYKNDKNVTVDVVSGKILFDVSKPLGNDETLMIKSANVITSVKGSTGEIRVENGNTVIVGLDGQIDCFILDSQTNEPRKIEVAAGKLVQIKNTDNGTKVETRAVSKNDISGFSKIQIVQDPELKQRVIAGIGTKIGNVSAEEAITSFNQDISKQASEVATLAATQGVDPQTLVNSLMGADISSKTLDNITPAVNTSDSEKTESTTKESDSDSQSDQNVDKHVHDYVLDSTNPATCTEDGLEIYVCRGCGDSKNEIIPKAHDLSGESFTEQEGELGVTCSNCQEINLIEYKNCKVCDAKVQVGISNYYPSHCWSEPFELESATCTTDRKVERRCTIYNVSTSTQCSAIETYFEPDTKNPDNHDFVGTGRFEDGKEILKCRRCGEEKLAE